MDLKIKDVAEILQVSDKTIYRWIKENAIPVYQINHQYRFDKAEIEEWIQTNRKEAPGFTAPDKKAHDAIDSAGTGNSLRTSIKQLILKGGIYYRIEGSGPEECIRNSIALINLPQNTSREDVASEVLKRERIISTAVGGGLALPHSRDPVLSRAEDECVSICMLNSPQDFHALDGKQIHTLIFFFTASLQHHLECMTKISFLCRNNDFIGLIEGQHPRGEILSWIAEREAAWLQFHPASLM